MKNFFLRTKTIHLLLLLSISAVFVGCVPSLHSLFTEKDLTFDKALLGTWGADNDPKETWTFTKSENGYRLTTREKDGIDGEFLAALGKIDGHLFLDLYPDDSLMSDAEMSGLYKLHHVPVHTFIRVYQIEPTLKLGFFNPGWLDKALKKNPKLIGHTRTGSSDDGILLTASTPELQKFFSTYANDEDAFSAASELKRK